MVRAALLSLSCCAATVPAAKDHRLTLADDQQRASIVIAARPTEAAVFAAVELQHHLQKISGQTLPIVLDTERVTGVRILVGESAATRVLGLTSTAFQPQEYLIRFLPDTLVLMGRDAPKPFGVETIGSPRWVPGRFGHALAFDGTNDCVAVKVCAFPDEAGTIELWVNVLPETADGREQHLLRIDGDPWSYHILSRVGDRVTYSTYDGRQGARVTSQTLVAGWHHIAVTFDAAAQRAELFVDGASQGTASYAATHCRGQPLYIGGTMFNVPPGGRPSAAFRGEVDDVRISSVARAPQVGGPATMDADTCVLLNFDEGSGCPGASVRSFNNDHPPDYWDEQATCYAVYDFLERFCGVRWYGPTEVCTVYDRQPKLIVAGREIRRRPAMAYRYILYPPYPTPDVPINMIPWGNPTARDMRLYWHRMRNGGERYNANHSFSGYYDRFWERNPAYPERFEQARPQWFAQGYHGKPPQPCFTSEGFIGQVVQDARDYFNGKPLRPGACAAGDFFAVVPEDNNRFCQCPSCQAEVDPTQRDNPRFNTGKYSDYIFRFTNRVAEEVAKTHPGKYIAQLAYNDYAYYPRKVRLRRNISVQLCLHVNNWWCPAMEESDLTVYRGWIGREKGRRPLYLWLYSQFPHEIGYAQGFNVFPGFSARLIARQMKMFARDGIRGLFLNGYGSQLNTYMYHKLADDPTLDPEQVLDEFFVRYYGPAAAPMRQLWLGIEETYCNPTNYPDEVRYATRDWHQTEELAWKYLGTEERMTSWSNLLAQAKSLAGTGIEYQRVMLFEEGIWIHMVQGRNRYLQKARYETEVNALKSQPPPSARVPHVLPLDGGDVRHLAWDAVSPITIFRTVTGYPASRTIDARLLHDGSHLYLRFSEPLNGTQLAYTDSIFGMDNWEIFVAAQRAKPYRQFGLNPAGQFVGLVFGEGEPWNHGARVVSELTQEKWTVYVTLPLHSLIPGGAKIGQPFYINFIRGTTGGREPLAWSPNFGNHFHDPARLGELVLEPISPDRGDGGD